MSVTANACPACSVPVPYGRLSCPACGELLAAVAGPARRIPAPAPTIEHLLDAEDAALEAEAIEPEPDRGPLWVAGSEPEPVSWPGSEPVVLAATAAEPSSVALARADVDADDDEESPFLEPEPEAYPARPAAFVAASAAPAAPGVVGAPPASLALPPAVVASLAAAVPIAPSSAVAMPIPAAASADAAVAAGRSPMSVRLPTVSMPALRVGKLPEQLVVAGAGLAAVSFALPWGSAMIGAPSFGQPWVTLGIMGSWHILALLAVLGTLVAAVRGTRIAPWLRFGVVPLLLSGALLGLAWPYLTTSLGRGVGVYAVLVGAIAMGVGAVLALRAATHPIAIRSPERNAAPAPTV